MIGQSQSSNNIEIMEQLISDFLLKAGGSAWIVVALLTIVWIAKEPLTAVLKSKELKQKDRELLLEILKEQTLLSESARSALLEGLEREEITRYTGVSLSPRERSLLIPFVANNEHIVRWSDIKRVRTHLILDGSGVLELKITKWDLAVYWFSRLFTTFQLLVAIASLIFGSYLAVFASEPNNTWLAYGFLYLFLAFVTRATWVSPHDSYKKLKPMFPLGTLPNLVVNLPTAAINPTTQDPQIWPEEVFN